MFSILQRMIFIELFRVFFLCWIGLTGMILLGGVIAEATQQGLGPSQILEIIPFLVPSTMPYTLPTTTLFATCIVYGRLAHDNEVLAVKAAGINLIQIVIPAILLGGIASAGTMALYCDVIPSTHWELRRHFVDNLEDFLYNMLRKDGCIRHPNIEWQIFAKRVEGRDLIDAEFMHRDPKSGAFDIIARGRKARLIVNQEKKVITVHMWDAKVRKENNEEGKFDEIEWPVEIKNIDPEKTRPTDMTWPELAEYQEQAEKDIARDRLEIANHEAVMMGGNAPPEFGEHIRHKRFSIRANQSMLANIATEYQMRPALSLGCLCFVLVGCPVGIWFSRSDYLSSFITCFLPIIVVYYPLMLCGINLSKSGKLLAALAIWPANVAIALAATWLLRRLMRN